jgi:hypothetical protein
MTKQTFSDSVKEDLNRSHNVTLTEGQIATILYVLEGYVQGNDDTELCEEIDKIFGQLEGVVDSYYNVTKCIIDGNDYSECVDSLVDRMKTTK